MAETKKYDDLKRRLQALRLEVDGEVVDDLDAAIDAAIGEAMQDALWRIRHEYPEQAKIERLEAERDRMNAGLLHAREFILQEHGLPTMQAHYEGHPVEECARSVWDSIHQALKESSDAGGI